MGKPAIDISKLTPDEKLDLIDDLWRSLDPEDLPLSPELRAELDRRLDRFLGGCPGRDDTRRAVRSVIFVPEARAEALEIFRWYETQRRGLGALFRTELNGAIRRIRDAPLAYAPEYRDIRRVLVNRFPYAVFYRILPRPS
jgi:toxin ParE1/3/4